MNFITKDSGKREAFETGSVRDTQEGKPRWDLVPWETFERVVGLYTRGAEKYGDDNWRKGQPMKRTLASLFRHLFQWIKGDKDEDHGAAVVWNMLSLMWHEDNKPELDDIHEQTTNNTTDSGVSLGCDDSRNCSETYKGARKG